MTSCSTPRSAALGEAELLRDLGRVFRRTRPDGLRVFAEEEVRSLLFVLFLRMTPEGRANVLGSAEVSELIGEYAIRIGIAPGDDPDRIGRAIEAYYRSHPIDPALRAEVEALLREKASGAYARASIGALSKLLGDAGPRRAAGSDAPRDRGRRRLI